MWVPLAVDLNPWSPSSESLLGNDWPHLKDRVFSMGSVETLPAMGQLVRVPGHQALGTATSASHTKQSTHSRARTLKGGALSACILCSSFTFSGDLSSWDSVHGPVNWSVLWRGLECGPKPPGARRNVRGSFPARPTPLDFWRGLKHRCCWEFN